MFDNSQFEYKQYNFFERRPSYSFLPQNKSLKICVKYLFSTTFQNISRFNYMDLTVNDLIYRGIILRDSQKNLEEALSLFYKALEKEPNNSAVIAETAKTILVIELDKEESIDDEKLYPLQNMFLKAINLNKNNVVAWKGLADILLLLQRDDEAINAYEKIIELEPKNPQNWLNIAWAIGDKDFEAQINCCKHALKLAKNDSFILTEIGTILESMFFIDIAKQFYKSALELEPDYEPAINQLTSLSLDEATNESCSQVNVGNHENLFSLLEDIRKHIL